MRVTIRDVARAAGVSVATVSRVLNDSGPVNPETRRRIREIATSLRYTPDGAARSLITRRTSAIGILLPDLHGEFFSELIRGMDQGARRLGYHVLLSSSHNDRREIEAALRAMHGRVDGLIVLSTDLDAAGIAATIPESLPLVLLDAPPHALPPAPHPAIDTLAIDNYGGAYAMVRHVLGHGHRVLATITGPEGNADADERLRGFRDAVRDASRGGAPVVAVELTGDFSEGSGYRATAALLARAPRPTAVFAANDAMAIGAMSALHRAGVRVPDEVALAGFDDIPMGRYVSPPLSSVQVAISELGRRAAETVVHAIRAQNRHERRQVVMPTRLVLRGSCGHADAEVPGEVPEAEGSGQDPPRGDGRAPRAAPPGPTDDAFAHDPYTRGGLP